jgi:hypothetical protein
MAGERKPSRGPILIAGLGVVVGAMVAIGSSWLFAWRPQPAPTDETDSPDPTNSAGPGNAATRRPARRSRAEEGAPERKRPEAAAAVERGAAPPSAEQIMAQHQQRVQQHFLQLVDNTWAPAATGAYDADLKALGQQMKASFKVTSLDCRSETCVAELEWPSRARAMSDWQEVLHFPYRTGCSREIVLPEPSGVPGEDNRPLRASVIYDCAGRKDVPIPPGPLVPPIMVTRTSDPPPAPAETGRPTSH